MKQVTYQSKVFGGVLILLNLCLAACATPVSYLDDTPHYLLLAQSFLGLDVGLNLAHRSPLYSILLAGFMLLLKPPLLYKLVVLFQYALLAGSSWMLYQIFRRVFSTDRFAMLAALLFNCSLGAIYFANILLPEILGAFLLVVSLRLLLQFYDTGKWVPALFLGAVVGLLGLARFNTVPLIATYGILVLVAMVRQPRALLKRGQAFGLFLLSYLIVVNAWCLYNQSEHGFYGLFPHIRGSVSRNVTIASIRPDYSVSVANKPIMDIFLEARRVVLDTGATQLKGSFLNAIEAKFGPVGFLTDLQWGYPVYWEARPQLLRYFNLPDSAGEYALALKLAGFYIEINRQNQGFVRKARLYSLLNSFRAANSGALPLRYGNTNLNVLPALVFQIYKLAFPVVSLVVLFAFFAFAWRGITAGWQFDFTLLAMFLIVFSFWGINAAFVTTSDANSYKFPAEPLITGLFLYYAIQAWAWIRIKFRPPDIAV